MAIQRSLQCLTCGVAYPLASVDVGTVPTACPGCGAGWRAPGVVLRIEGAPDEQDYVRADGASILKDGETNG